MRNLVVGIAEVLTFLKDFFWIPLIGVMAIAIPIWNSNRLERNREIREERLREKKEALDRLKALEDKVSDMGQELSETLSEEKVRQLVSDKLESLLTSLNEISRMMEASDKNEEALRDSSARQDEKLKTLEKEVDRLRGDRYEK